MSVLRAPILYVHSSRQRMSTAEQQSIKQFCGEVEKGWGQGFCPLNRHSLLQEPQLEQFTLKRAVNISLVRA